LCAIAFIANLFWNYNVDEYLFEGMIYLTMAGLGFTASERFAYKNKKSENEQ
jgi:RsiW-degrading membrane proteinase PrsW (M82 family)